VSIFDFTAGVRAGAIAGRLGPKFKLLFARSAARVSSERKAMTTNDSLDLRFLRRWQRWYRIGWPVYLITWRGPGSQTRGGVRRRVCMLWLRTVLFALLVPSTELVLVPYFLVRRLVFVRRSHSAKLIECYRRTNRATTVAVPGLSTRISRVLTFSGWTSPRLRGGGE